MLIFAVIFVMKAMVQVQGFTLANSLYTGMYVYSKNP